VSKKAPNPPAPKFEPPAPPGPPLPLGAKTQWGVITAVTYFGGQFGERYYFMVDKHGTVSMMPEGAVEVKERKGRQSNSK